VGNFCGACLPELSDIRLGPDNLGTVPAVEMLNALAGVAFGGLFTIIAWLLLFYSVALIIVMRIPFRFEKNKRFVRWIFLFRMHRRYGFLPQMANIWLKEQEAEEAQTKADR
jgi:hypothetical protein